MRLSIIICTRNRVLALCDTLHTLSSTRVPDGAEAEIIVVDNGSHDDTRNRLQRFRISGFSLKYIYEPNGGKSAALNTGIRSAQGDIIILTDDDVRPTTEWLRELIQPIARRTYDAVAGRVTLAAHLTKPWMKLTHTSWLAATEYLDPEAPSTAVGANMAFRRTILNHVPAFDEELGPGKLGLWEDTLFSLQLTKAGYKLGMANMARVEHHFDPSRLKRGAFLSRALSEGRSSAYVAWHWRHESPSRSAAWRGELFLRLFVKRALRWEDWHQNEGMPEWEMNLLTGIEYEKQLRKESLRPRTYKQFGTRRLR